MEEMKNNELAENLQFMRLAIERTRRDFDQEAYVMIVWGLVCMIGYSAIYFLVKLQLYNPRSGDEGRIDHTGNNRTKTIQ